MALMASPRTLNSASLLPAPLVALLHGQHSLDHYSLFVWQSSSEVGDWRVRFTLTAANAVSVVAQQDGNGFGAYQTKVPGRTDGPTDRRTDGPTDGSTDRRMPTCTLRHAHRHTHTNARMHARTHARTHAHTCTRARACTHAQTHWRMVH